MGERHWWGGGWMAAQMTFRDLLLRKELRVLEERFLKWEFNRSLSENAYSFISQARRMTFVGEVTSCPRIVSGLPSHLWVLPGGTHARWCTHRFKAHLKLWYLAGVEAALVLSGRPEIRVWVSQLLAPCSMHCTAYSLMVTQRFPLSSHWAMFVLGILQVSSFLLYFPFTVFE